MGSGEFAAAGAGKAAYMRNMMYQDAKSGFHDYTGGFWNSDIARYTNVSIVL